MLQGSWCRCSLVGKGKNNVHLLSDFSIVHVITLSFTQIQKELLWPYNIPDLFIRLIPRAPHSEVHVNSFLQDQFLAYRSSSSKMQRYLWLRGVPLS